ncbi:D-tyrosyl-tRNA(Tyr) deacylase [bacterium]|nr:D-tyrosyl-tRNA(Tyr) deacylase [bacterium]
MKAVVQKVKTASVAVDGVVISKIDYGFLVLLGIKKNDTVKDRDYIIKKLLKLRVFSNGDLNWDKNIVQAGGNILLVSQFTLYVNCKKGNRPSFYEAMPPQEAQKVYNDFTVELKKQYLQVKEGAFGAMMQVELLNDGPVTIIIDSENR